MKKKILAAVLAAGMVMTALTACGGSSDSGSASSSSSSETKTETTADADTEEEADADEGGSSASGDIDSLGLTADFDPNPDYDEYTLVDYTIEDANAEFVVTVSRMSDKSQYEIHCLFYGDEQVAVLKDGKVTEDKTGFMETDTPLIVEAAEAQGVWAPIE